MKNDRKPPLYRKVNTTAHNVRHGGGHSFSEDRHSRAFAERAESGRVSMKRGGRNGLDYTPLYRFLISKEGHRWDDVYSEAVSRLDKPDAIFHIVEMNPERRDGCVRIGESSYFSQMYVDAEGILRIVDPTINESSIQPYCACCTHTFNGKRFTKRLPILAPLSR